MTQNDPHKICLIHGNQLLLVEETANTLIDQRLEGREQEWSLERFNAQEMLKTIGESGKNSIDDLLISCETLPMLTDRKVIRIDNFELIKKAANKSDNSQAVRLFEALENIIKNPPESLWFVFTSPAMREQDFSKPLYRSIKQGGGRIQKFVAYDNSTPYNWVIQRGEQKGLPLTADVARLLINIVGNDLTDLDHELEKLSLYLSGKTVSEEMIKEHIRGHKHFSVFRMTEALSRKELLPALEILDHQLQSLPVNTCAFSHSSLCSFAAFSSFTACLNNFIRNQKLLEKFLFHHFSANKFWHKLEILPVKKYKISTQNFLNWTCG